MVKIRLELWLRLGKELGEEFHWISDSCALLEKEIEEGTTVRNFFEELSEKYSIFQERIFEREKGRISPEVVVTLNDRIIDPSELYDRILGDGDKITLLPMFSGG